MGSFASKQTIQVTAPDRPGEYIAVRAKLSMSARGELTDAMMSIANLGSDDQQLKLHAGKYNEAMLRAGVVGWRLAWDEACGLPQDPNDEGYVLFKPEFIGELDEDDALVDKALLELVERNPTLGRARRQS